MTLKNDPQPPSTLLITTLAIYQTEFWAAVAEQLRSNGIECVFLSFDDRSTEFLRQRNFEVFSSTEHPTRVATDDATLQSFMANFNIDNPNYWLSHERVTFGIGDSQVLRGKLLAYLHLVDGVCRDLLAKGKRIVMVQEVGGFLCVIASYFAARRHGIDNWFIEPSFFRGRLFFTKNTFAAPQPRGENPILSAEVRSYLDATLKNRQIVVPLKDSHHYSAAAKKILNTHNARRFVEKLIDKHLLGKHQEFGHVGHHVSTHVRMLQNSMRLRSYYRPLASVSRFIYFPFHVPADMALTIRAPAYLDQLALIDYLARVTPHTHVLAVKEHPAMIGAVDARRLIGLLRRYDNLVLLPPSSNNYHVLEKAEVVVSVNSKSGAEALLTGTPVIALGDSFYRDSGLVRVADGIEDTGPAIRELLNQPRDSQSRAKVEAFFQNIWDSSYPGELFVATADNSTTFSRSLLAALALTP